MLPRPFLFLAALAPVALAAVEFTSPIAGATITGGSTISVKWKDDGNTPSTTDLSSYKLFLCAGGNDASNFIQLAPIVEQGTFSTSEASGTIQANIGGSTTNAYFLSMISVATAGGTVTTYSPRFSLSGMTGTFPQNVIDGLKTIQGTQGPSNVNSVADAKNNPANAAAAGPFNVDYRSQTGLTKYAPSQPIPPTKITAKNAAPLYPTSAVVYAKTWLPLPSQVTTFTQSGTFSVSSRENTASPAAKPSDDMQKFLGRWKD